jgi:hypothetical protein
MDSQFNTLSRSYHDNYIQYATTGVASYKTAYEAAQQGLDTILNNLKKEVDTNSQNIKDSTGSDAGALFLDKQNGLNNIGDGIRHQRDRVTAAKMRQPPPPVPVSYTTQYYIVGGLMVTIVLLQFF